MVDAPVSGGVPRAVTGELAVMVGGAIGRRGRGSASAARLGDPARQFRTGRLGTGHAMKALNNVIAAAATCVTAEALVVGKRFGLDPRTMIDIVNASTGRSFVSGVFDSEVLTGRYGTGFALGLLAKDVHIAAERRRRGGRRRAGDRADRRAVRQGAHRARPRCRSVDGASGLVG